MPRGGMPRSEYLTRKYGGEVWLPGHPAQAGAIVQWLSLAGRGILPGRAGVRGSTQTPARTQAMYAPTVTSVRSSSKALTRITSS